uniref:Nucleolar protein 4 like n=1 Tax=Chrysemys picta bellii TaxID=8478 RepID=A0A8C3IVR8_CHRPI
MHVESSAEPGKAPKHAGQKKTYRAIAETYAFLPREAVTRFLMSCTECQKRMHFNSNGLEPKENEPPSSLVSGIIDYNMPLTSTYLKQMKLRVMNSQEQDLGYLWKTRLLLSQSPIEAERMWSFRIRKLQLWFRSPAVMFQMPQGLQKSSKNQNLFLRRSGSKEHFEVLFVHPKHLFK